MSLLIPDERDRWDQYSQLEQDDIYRDEIDQLQSEWRFSTVSGWFKQSLDATDDMKFNYTLADFGITKPWAQLVADLEQLNASAKPNECYKLLLLARHGEGLHNVANRKYTGEPWRTKWRFLETDGELTWGPDAALSDLGVAQAQENNLFLKGQVSKGMPIPGKFYASSLRRSSKTLEVEWTGIDIPNPIVTDRVRETIGINPCHRRSPKSQIEKNFPTFEFESGFPEKDVLFDEVYANERELYWQQFVRVHEFLSMVFENDQEQVVSVTSHAGSMRAFVTVVGHRKFTIPTGGMLPIVVKGTKN